MRPSGLMVFVFLLVFLISAAVHVPMAFIYSHLPKVKNFNIEQLDGTLWKGEAMNVTFLNKPLGRLVWDFQPMQILFGQLQFNISLSGMNDLYVKGQLGYSLSGVYAKDLSMMAPASLFQSFVPYPYPIELTGPVEVNIDQYEVTRPICSTLNGNVTWPGQLQSPLGNLDFGLVMSKMSCDGGSLVFNTESGSDAVESEFTLKLGPKTGRWGVKGWLIPGQAMPQSMKTQLGWLGSPDKEGKYSFEFGS